MSGTLRFLAALTLLAALVLLAILVSSNAWLWVFLAAVALLFAHARSGAYLALLFGGLMTGAAVGILLEVALRWQGAFLVSVGAGALMVEALEPRRDQAALILGLAFTGVGLVVTLSTLGLRGYLAASLVAAAAGVMLALSFRR